LGRAGHSIPLEYRLWQSPGSDHSPLRRDVFHDGGYDQDTAGAGANSAGHRRKYSAGHFRKSKRGCRIRWGHLLENWYEEPLYRWTAGSLVRIIGLKQEL